jgi:hypothetical protein
VLTFEFRLLTAMGLGPGCLVEEFHAKLRKRLVIDDKGNDFFEELNLG